MEKDKHNCNEAVRQYLIKVLADFHLSRLKNEGFDWFFVLSNDLEEVTPK